MEPRKFMSMETLWYENSTTALPVGSTKPPTSAEWKIIHAVIPPYIFILCLFGLLFNSFVLGVFVVDRDKLAIAEIYLSNLALADFLLLCGLPFWAMNILNDFNWPYGEVLCKLVNSIIIINFYTSIYTLVMISIDRYLAVVQPMKARWLRRTLYAKVACCILWMLGFLMSMPTMVHRKVKLIEEYGIMACVMDYQHDSPWKLAHHILMNMIGFILPVLVIVFSSRNILKALALRKKIEGFHDTNDKKTAILVYSVTLLFLLCWGPFQLFIFLNTLCDLQVLDEMLWFKTLDIGSQFSVYVAFLNSGLNPLLYVFCGQYFRRKVIAIYRRKRYQRRGSDMTTYQRSVVSTYFNKTDQIKTMVIFDVKDQM